MFLCPLFTKTLSQIPRKLQMLHGNEVFKLKSLSFSTWEATWLWYSCLVRNTLCYVVLWPDCTHSFSVPLPGCGHVLLKLLPLLGGGLQAVPQLLDASAVGSAKGLVLRPAALQLYNKTKRITRMNEKCITQIFPVKDYFLWKCTIHNRCSKCKSIILCREITG